MTIINFVILLLLFEMFYTLDMCMLAIYNLSFIFLILRDDSMNKLVRIIQNFKIENGFKFIFFYEHNCFAVCLFDMNMVSYHRSFIV